MKNVEVVEERIVNDGNIWASSGVSAGIDRALEFIKHEAGDGTAGSVQSFAEYYPSGKNYRTVHKDPQTPGYLARESTIGFYLYRGFIIPVYL